MTLTSQNTSNTKTQNSNLNFRKWKKQLRSVITLVFTCTIKQEEITHSTFPSATVSHVECLPSGGVEELDAFGSSTATSYLPADRGQRRCLSYNNNSALYVDISSEDFTWFLSRRVPSRSLDRVTRSSELRRNLLRGGGSWFSIKTAPRPEIQTHSYWLNTGIMQITHYYQPLKIYNVFRYMNTICNLYIYQIVVCVHTVAVQRTVSPTGFTCYLFGKNKSGQRETVLFSSKKEHY